MNLVEIEALLDKYYSGNTSLEEERLLANYFLTEDVPGHLAAVKEQFVFLSSEENKVPLAGNLDERISNMIAREANSTKNRSKMIRTTIMAVAAGFLLIFAIRALISDSGGVVSPQTIRTSIKADSNVTTDSIDVKNPDLNK